jgi:hypothetical protein
MAKRKASRAIWVGSAVAVTTGMAIIKIVGYVAYRVVTTFIGGI